MQAIVAFLPGRAASAQSGWATAFAVGIAPLFGLLSRGLAALVAGMMV